MVNEDYSQSFSPIIGPLPQVLFLGTMPGKESLRKQQYYAHPRNAFWKLLYTLYNGQYSKEYNNRINFANQNHIALWDVCQYCIRKGSLDADIKEETPNNFETLLNKNPSIHTIIFNGQKAEKLYNKHFDIFEGIKYFTVLSSSPANASFTFEQKLENWKLAIFNKNSIQIHQGL